MSPGPSFLLPCHFPLVIHSPHNPPYKQLLIGMGVGAVALGVIVIILLRCSHCCCSTHDPPHEQLLMRLGVGGVVSFVLLLPCCCHPLSLLPFHPQSTPRAVARGAGGGWCVIHHVVLVLGSSVMVSIMAVRGGGVMQLVAPKPPCKQLLIGMVVGGMSSLGAGVIVMPLLLLMWPLAPTIHPASDCSQQWGWVPLLVVANGLWGWWVISGDVAHLRGSRVHTLQVPHCTGLLAPSWAPPSPK